jgi:AbrB family looped-hinge helix DNA binding protein
VIEQRRHVTRINKRNQVTIPAEMLRDLGLEPGDEVEVEEAGGKLAVTKLSRPAKTKQEYLDAIERASGSLWRPNNPVLSDEELEEAIRVASEEGATERYRRSFAHD